MEGTLSSPPDRETTPVPPVPFSACKPNIVMLFTDDHSYKHVGCYNSHVRQFVQTPNLDRLAAEGMRCDRAYATSSLCSLAGRR